MLVGGAQFLGQVRQHADREFLGAHKNFSQTALRNRRTERD